MFMRFDAPTVRRARPADAGDIARLVDIAGEGLPSHFWAGMAEPGEPPLAVGIRRIAGGEGVFSWRNVFVAEIGDRVVGALVTYRIGPEPRPLETLPPVFRPLQALENEAPGTHYVNVLATYPEFRRRGVASRLLAEAERQGLGARGLSLIVADANMAARRLYEAWGFAEAARAAMVKDGWEGAGREWVLMVKPAG